MIFAYVWWQHTLHRVLTSGPVTMKTARITWTLVMMWILQSPEKNKWSILQSFSCSVLWKRVCMDMKTSKWWLMFMPAWMTFLSSTRKLTPAGLSLRTSLPAIFPALPVECAGIWVKITQHERSPLLSVDENMKRPMRPSWEGAAGLAWCHPLKLDLQHKQQPQRFSSHMRPSEASRCSRADERTAAVQTCPAPVTDFKRVTQWSLSIACC